MEEKKKENDRKVITAFWPDKGQTTLAEYLDGGGFSVFKKALAGGIKPADAIEELEKSGLAGRGGGGFKTGTKWRLAREEIKKASPPKNSSVAHAYFICNADESEPGTYKDRLIIEKCPYLALEGMLLGAWATGTEKGFVYVNGSYRDTAHILRQSIANLIQAGWLGKSIQKSDFSFEIQVFEGAGSYVCGEETALLNSIEGKRGEPRLRPPFPVQKGLFGRPTLINNAETLACVPYILKKGAGSFKMLGRSETSFGTKLFVLNGALNSPGVYEAPLGVTLRELIEDYGRGIPAGKELKCVQVGGDSGVLYSLEEIDKPLGYDKKSEIPVGSGAVLVIDSQTDLKKLLLAWARFFRRESCGKCVPCREGTYQLFLLAERIAQNKTLAGDRERLEDIILTMGKASFCAFGSYAVNSWESALKLFSKEMFGQADS